MQTFGERLIALRESRGFSCNRLALESDVSQSFLSKIELGQRKPPANILDKIAPVLGIPAEQLQAWADEERLGTERMAGIQAHVLADLEMVKLKVASLDGAIRAMRDGLLMAKESMAAVEVPLLGQMEQALAQGEAEMGEIREHFEAELGRPLASEGFAAWVQGIRYHDVAGDPEAIHRIVRRLQGSES